MSEEEKLLEKLSRKHYDDEEVAPKKEKVQKDDSYDLTEERMKKAEEYTRKIIAGDKGSTK